MILRFSIHRVASRTNKKTFFFGFRGTSGHCLKRERNQEEIHFSYPKVKPGPSEPGGRKRPVAPKDFADTLILFQPWGRGGGSRLHPPHYYSPPKRIFIPSYGPANWRCFFLLNVRKKTEISWPLCVRNVNHHIHDFVKAIGFLAPQTFFSFFW